MRQETQLRIRTNIPDTSFTGVTATLDLNQFATIYAHMVGSGTTASPYTGTTISAQGLSAQIYFTINDGDGLLYYAFTGTSTNPSSLLINGGVAYSNTGTTYVSVAVKDGDSIVVKLTTGSTITTYLSPTPDTVYQYEELDLYKDIPIKISKSFSELQDISKKNSDYSIGLKLPGSKKNNKFFENFYNVDNIAFYFNPNLRTFCDVLIDNVVYFTGYMKLNKINVKDTAYEYDVTLYSTVGNLVGSIGNNLLIDLDYGDPQYKFNHIFSSDDIFYGWRRGYYDLESDGDLANYIYPIIHNGYEYTGDTVNLSGGTISEQTRLFTSTGPIGSWETEIAATSIGVQEYRLNSPTQSIIDNQLKPAINVAQLIKLMFKTYGYSLKSDFMNTPWAKTLYMYGPFNTDEEKLSYRIDNTVRYSYPQVDVIYTKDIRLGTTLLCGESINLQWEDFRFVVVKKGTLIPCLCDQNITVATDWLDVVGGTSQPMVTDYSVIPAGENSILFSRWILTIGWVSGCDYGHNWSTFQGVNLNESTTNVYEAEPLYDFNDSREYVNIVNGDLVNFSTVLSPETKQIDVLSSFMKKFNLILFPNPNNPNELQLESYDYFVGTGDIYDWTDKLSYDKGFTIEPAQNYVETNIILTDKDGNDHGNKQFKEINSKTYGENISTNPTDFKSTVKTIKTEFIPSVFSKWDEYNTLPLLNNYSSKSKDTDGVVSYQYKALKTETKLFYFIGSLAPYFGDYKLVENLTYGYSTFNVNVRPSDGSLARVSNVIPVIANSTHLGNPDSNKINNDTQSILFGSEDVVNLDADTFNAYTENDAYNSFYSNRINNLFDPNTRFISGYFNLGLKDIKSLKPNDIIKIKEQYFTWNKIDGYYLSNDNLTKVQLVQKNSDVKEYPVRYFKYYYCDNPNDVYKLKTDFTNDKLINTNQHISVLYDYFAGIKEETERTTISSVTSSFFINYLYYGFTMVEITKDEYDDNGYLDWDYDELLKGWINIPPHSLQTVWAIHWTTSTESGLNVYLDCSDFETTAIAHSLPTGTDAAAITGTSYNFYYYEVAINDGTKLPNKYDVKYFDMDGVQQTVTITNLIDHVIKGAREYSLTTEYNGITWDKVRYYDTTHYDPVTGLKDPPDDSALDKTL